MVIKPEHLADVLLSMCREYAQDCEAEGQDMNDCTEDVLVALGCVLGNIIECAFCEGHREDVLDTLTTSIKKSPSWDEP